MPLSVFELVTAEYDLKNSPAGNPADDIRRLAADQRQFCRVRQELEQHVVELGSETKLFRVRDHDGVPAEPWPSHGMRGHPDFPAYRANVQGQPVLYCADSAETAFAEVRAEEGRYFTVAHLQSSRLLRLVNVVGKRGVGAANPFALIDLWMSHRVENRSRILRPFPVGNEQEHYYATQLFSSIVRAEGYDGICFSSSVRASGLNFALFDPCSVDIIDCKLAQYLR